MCIFLSRVNFVLFTVYITFSTVCCNCSFPQFNSLRHIYY